MASDILLPSPFQRAAAALISGRAADSPSSRPALELFPGDLSN